MTRIPVTTDDLVQSGAVAREALSQISGDDWVEKPPNMEWTRLITASHICNALLFYATQLASGVPEPQESAPLDESIVTGEKLSAVVASHARLLAVVAGSASPGTRGWHPTGLPDAEGFLAMGCAEILLHTWDALAGTGIEFVGDEGTAGRVLGRLLPWAPADTPRWQTLLFATGRGDLPGRESPGDRWMWHNAVLEEWDGYEKRSDHWVGRV